MRCWIYLFVGVFCFLSSCAKTQGHAIDPQALGYVPCSHYVDCGPGRYCNPQGFCWADCRVNGDCALFGDDLICNLFGQCLPVDGDRTCSAHADCGEGRFCNGVCTLSGAYCGSSDGCPFPENETCQGRCAANCGSDNDCLVFGQDQSCVPIGQCLVPGWERWISPGELPPLRCTRDSQCKALGWRWECDCEKTEDPKSRQWLCANGRDSVCAKSAQEIDFGDGPGESPAHAFRGVFGLRLVIASVTSGLPLVGKQNVYSDNLFLVKSTHRVGTTLEFDLKTCDIKLSNFLDSDQPFKDLAWGVIPSRYIYSLNLNHQTVDVASAAVGAPFAISTFYELRGCLLQDALNDPLPNRHDFDIDPSDPRIWDQDRDGKPGMTNLMDGVMRGEIYNVQRWGFSGQGEILDADHIRGLATVHNEVSVISASSAALLYDTTTEMHPQADRTYLRMIRLDDNASCADFLRESNRQDSWMRHSNHMMDVADP